MKSYVFGYLMRALVVFLGLANGTYVNAEVVITAITREPEGTRTYPYLSAAKDDQAYIAITARVIPPEGAACVTPTNLGGADNFFTSKRIEVAIVSVVEGFAQIDPKQPIPLAAFQASDSDGKYCMSPWSLPAILVPNHRFAERGPTGAPEPKITLSMLYTSASEERISSLITGWLGVAGAFATGGAANTVVGLTNIASNKAISTLSQMYNERSKNKTDQKFSINLPWTLLQSGPSKLVVSFLSTEPKWNEPVENAVRRVRSEPSKAKPVLDIVLNFEYRRSLFLTDTYINPTTLDPNKVDSRLASENVLSFPGQSPSGQVYPNIVQAINSQAPSVAQGLNASGGATCNRIFGVLRGLGLNEFDRAIAAKAVLDDLKPGWNSVPAFYNACFGSERELASILARVFSDAGKSSTEFFSNPPALRNIALVPAGGDVARLGSDLERRLVELSSALSLKAEQVIKESSLRTAINSAAPLSWMGPIALSNTSIDDQIKELTTLDFERISCLYRVSSESALTGHMLALVRPKGDSTVHQPQLLTLTFGASPSHPLSSLTVNPVLTDGVAQSHVAFLKSIPGYQSPSSCADLLATIKN